MKVFFQKFRRVKKRKFLSKSIGLFSAVLTFKYGAMNSNEINSVSPQVDYSQTTQPVKALYLDNNFENDTDLIELKTGSGTVLVVRKHQNQTSEAYKSAFKIRGGFSFDVVSIVGRSNRLEEYAKDANEKYPDALQKLRDDLKDGHFKSGRGHVKCLIPKISTICDLVRKLECTLDIQKLKIRQLKSLRKLPKLISQRQ